MTYKKYLEKGYDIKEEVLALHELGHKTIDIVKAIEEIYGLTNMYDIIYSMIRYHNLKKKMNNVSEKPEKVEPGKLEETLEKQQKRIIMQNFEPEVTIREWDGAETITFGLISDTHLGNKHTQLTYLHNFYDLCAERGITDIYHAGDITDGLKMRRGHEYEVYVTSADELKEDVVKNYPKRDGITTHFIGGNHDITIFRHVGHDICKAIAKDRDDMRYLGQDCAVVNLTPKCTLELSHPWDGSAYSISYKPQKRIEAMEADSKPNILAIGNYHKAEYLFYRNVHCFQTGCFESQTPFMRGKNLSANMGGWIVTINVDKEGTIKSIAPEFVPCYKAITDDWKKYHNI